MSRKGRTPKRIVLPDPVFGSELIQRFINRLMLSGKKVRAEKIVYRALEICEEKEGKPALEIFEKALQNCMPVTEVRPRRVGGQTYQVPVEVRPARRRTLAIRWLVSNSRKRSGKSMIEKLSGELIDAYNGQGATVKKKEDTHKMAEANKAFAHFRF
ncbi:MAG: 30S ribosomal protein S7 [Fimbriimonadales bacterium]|nr:30S ribosomal protein S7 [Armatimonadota bacterium]MBV6502632.1 30S ribosomal protein S7 [Fimbriimonadales bacterium]NOG91841.1 30S ribosomal protein S7 [Armatimonadota bacterium]